MPMCLISVKIDEKLRRKKISKEVSWRYIIGKGLIHLDECVPMQNEMMQNYQNILRARTHARCMHYIRTKHPKIYDRMMLEVSHL